MSSGKVVNKLRVAVGRYSGRFTKRIGRQSFLILENATTAKENYRILRDKTSLFQHVISHKCKWQSSTIKRDISVWTLEAVRKKLSMEHVGTL